MKPCTFAEKSMDKFDYVRLDSLMKMIDECQDGIVLKKTLLNEKDSPEDWYRAVAFLTDEGYIKEFDDYFEITFKGRILVHDGGFRRKDIRQRALLYCTLIAAVCSFVGLVVSLLAFLC